MATDYVLTSFGASGVTGVEIPPVTDTEKAVLPLSAALATPTARTFAVIAEAVPAKLFDSRDALCSFLSVEISRLLSESFDSHVVGKIEAAAPPTGLSGATLIEQIRNGIRDMRNRGGSPTVIALDPDDAALLDLSVDGAGHYVFRVDLEGSGSPVWSLVVRETPSVTAPLLVSPRQLGLSYVGEASVLVDPYSSMQTNQVRVRVEAEAVFHVRNAVQGAHLISA